MRFKERLLVAIGRRQAIEAALSHDQVGFTLRVDDATSGMSAHHLEWREINTIGAFKVDGLATGETCLRFETTDRSLLVNEEAAGWDGFLQVLPERLPGCWDGKTLRDAVARLAPGENATIIFEGEARDAV